MATAVRVVCRFRPQNQKEIDQGSVPIVAVSDDKTSVTIKGAEANHTFTFDRIFDSSSTQKQVFDYAAKPVIEDIMRGYNGTIFVYGQTSSGKTHTMQGPNIEDAELRGIIPRMNGTIFEAVMNADPSIEFLVKASYIEIYMEKIKDLLDVSKPFLQVREEKTKGIWVEGATEVYVSSEQDVLEIIRTGSQNRAIAETKMNFESSRSHSIFILTVQQKNLNDGSLKAGKLYLVDLAGSEKVEKTGATGTTLDEAKMINKSLSALGNVINSLTDGKSTHVPYRDSKLTRVLQESLGGNSRTTLVINCSPSSYNEAETLSTLRFGNRAKNIQNKAKINQERSVAELKILLAKSEKEIERLTKSLGTLQSEVAMIKAQNPNLNLSGLSAAAGVVAEGGGGGAVTSERITELESLIAKIEEEKKELSEANDTFAEELKEKEADFQFQLVALRDKVDNLTQTEETTAKENELLIVKLADLTIANEKMQYDNDELQLQLESSTAQMTNLNQELTTMTQKMETLEQQQRKKQLAAAASLDDVTSAREDGAAASPTATPTPADKQQQNIDDIEISGTAATTTAATTGEQHGEILALRAELEAYKKEVETLRREKQETAHQHTTTSSPTGATGGESGELAASILSTSSEAPSTAGLSAEQAALVEAEYVRVREQVMSEFDAVKGALLRDLENRCQKVIELEILLDEAREQYQLLLTQVKNSNSKTLQQKCNFLQRNLEQLTAVQQQLVNENNRLKLENQVYVKQLAIRNERIHGLELLLQDAQEKLQKHAANAEAEHAAAAATAAAQATRKGSASKGSNSGSQAVIAGGRIAKPLRGGGGTTNTATIAHPSNDAPPSISVQSPSSKHGSSSNNNNASSAPGSPADAESRRSNSGIWGLFRSTSSSKKEDLPSAASTSSPAASPAMHKSASQSSLSTNQQ